MAYKDKKPHSIIVQLSEAQWDALTAAANSCPGRPSRSSYLADMLERQGIIIPDPEPETPKARS